MKNKKALTSFLLWFVALTMFADSGIYICGHLRRDRPNTVNTLKASGYTFGILFNVHVNADGTLVTDGETICRNGEYVFGNTSPYYVDDVNALLTGNTSILRLEHCIGGWDNHAYKNIADLVKADESVGGGTGPNSILYRNFKALKDAIPAVIAVNNDIEHDYDFEPHVQFHIMLYDIGFKTTIAPYHWSYKSSYWEKFVDGIQEARPGAVDRNYLQCYGGGAGNNPNDWKIGGLPIYGSFDIEGGNLGSWNPISKVTDKLNGWKESAGIVGGFYWNYNENRDIKPQAAAVNAAFGGGEVEYRDQIVAMVYSVADYKSPQIDFNMGTYSFEQISDKGFDTGDLAAIKLKEGIKMILYTEEDNTGESFEITSDTPDIAAVVEDKEIKSWTVMADCIDSLDGKEFYIKNKNSGYYLKLSRNNESDVNIQQRSIDDTDYSIWILNKVKDDLYKITNKGSEKVLTVNNSGVYDELRLVQNTYSETENQHFIIRYDEVSETYRLIALNSLKYVGLTRGSENRDGGAVVQRSSSSAVGIDWELLNEIETGVESLETKPVFDVYPRIVVDKVFVESSDVPIKSVRILDMSGRELIEKENPESEINVASLPKGIYLLLVEGKEVDKHAAFKIIKK